MYPETCPDDLWLAEKFQSNLEIAGSLRNIFRYSLRARVVEVEHCLDEGPSRVTESR